MTQSFTVKNYKGVREITLQPEGSLVVIAGANGAGKSSFIDGICELFDARGTKLTPKPIRDGEDEARAELVKAVETLDPEKVHRGAGVRIERRPVRNVDTARAAKDFTEEKFPELYQTKTTVSLVLDRFKEFATERGILSDYHKVSYRLNITPDETAYADAADEEDLGF